MPQQKNNRLLSWLVMRPIMFAIIAFVMMSLAAIIASLAGGRIAGPLANILAIVAFLGATGWLVRRLPGENLNQRDFIKINNAQMFITSIVFIISTLAIVYNAQAIMMRLLWLESHSTPSFIALIITLAMFYLYLCGIFIANLYAKYRRIRALGVGMWKILATAPFGFAMLWIPGYLMADASAKAGDNKNEQGWYNRLTSWIMARNYRMASVLVLLIILSGFTFGYPALLLTLGLGAIFAAWTSAVGTDRMRKNIGGAYATTAIVINIVALTCIIGYASIIKHAPRTSFENAPQITTPQQDQS